MRSCVQTPILPKKSVFSFLNLKMTPELYDIHIFIYLSICTFKHVVYIYPRENPARTEDVYIYKAKNLQLSKLKPVSVSSAIAMAFWSQNMLSMQIYPY
jgi:hypothetical protein